MAYSDPNGYVLLVDAVGTTADDIDAPSAGETLLYTTQQGLVLERALGAGADAWFCDKPVILSGGSTTLTSTYATILTATHTIPDQIDAANATYCIEISVQGTFTGTTAPTSNGVLLAVYVDGSSVAEFVIPRSTTLALSGVIGSTVKWWFTAGAGDVVDVRAKEIGGSDDGVITAVKGTLRRDYIV